MDKALHYKKLDQAFAIAIQAAQNKISPDLIHYYLAWCFALNNEVHQVYKHLMQIKNPASLSGEMQQNYIMLCNDTVRMLNIRKK
jgi:hypothetical protein